MENDGNNLAFSESSWYVNTPGCLLSWSCNFHNTFLGAVCYVYHWVKNKRVEFFWSGDSAGRDDRITVKTKVLSLLGGILLGLSLTLMKKAFVFTSPAEKGKWQQQVFHVTAATFNVVGPVTAISGAAIIVVSLYGHFVFGELLTRKHVFLIIMVGLLV